MIEIRNIKHTILQLEPVKKLVKKYAYSLKLKKDIIIVFDKRLKDSVGGYHSLNSETQKHNIQISPKCEDINDDAAKKYILLSYIIHELKHAQQFEIYGYQYFHKSKKFAIVEEIKDADLSAFWSKCELEARMYENKHLHSAVDFYNKHVIS